MLDGSAEGQVPPVVKASGWKPGKKRGWSFLSKGMYVVYRTDGSRELSVGCVLHNRREEKTVELHSCRSRWTGTSVVHLKEYRSRDDGEVQVVLDPTEDLVKIIAQVWASSGLASPAPRLALMALVESRISRIDWPGMPSSFNRCFMRSVFRWFVHFRPQD